MADKLIVTAKLLRAGDDMMSLIDLLEVIDLEQLKKFIEYTEETHLDCDEEPCRHQEKFQMATWFVSEWQKKFNP